jgi:uncharacterized protein (TIGR01777 family)
MPLYVRESTLAAPVGRVYEWHTRPGAFRRLTPYWESARVLKDAPIQDGNEAILQVGAGPFKWRWVARYQDCLPGRRFRDEQVSGPFPHWLHSHDFISGVGDESRMRDHLDYDSPLGMNGGLIGDWVHYRLDRLFRFRHERLQNDFKRLAAYPFPPKKILMTGASGFVGKPLFDFLNNAGHEVWTLVRRAPQPGAKEIFWDWENGSLDLTELEGFDAVIHLAGENIASGRWNRKRKAAIRRSRVEGTGFLAESLARLKKPPKAFISASAIGYYGDRQDEELFELSQQGYGFLSDACDAWEKAAAPLKVLGVRVAHVRTGIVLNGGGGALKQMVTPFSLGLGGVMGLGKQWMSWIALEDLVAVYYFLLTRDDLSGPFNAAAPGAVTNRDFTFALGDLLDRPVFLSFPASALKLLLGEMGERLLLEGQRVIPDRLTQAGFQFFYPDLKKALPFELGLYS